MPGYRGGSSYAAAGIINGYSAAAVTAGQNLSEARFPWTSGRIGGIEAGAGVAGTGAGTTVLDVLVNGVSIWNTAGDRPTLLATSTGTFAMNPPNAKGLRYGDLVQLQVASVSTTGHARQALTVGLEKG
jgi:hypothetical protein